MSEKGQVVIPAELREKYGWTRGDQFAVEDRGDAVVLLPLPKNPVLALRGKLRGHDKLTEALLAERATERRQESR